MLPANKYVLRLATEHDAVALRRLGELDHARPLTGRVLIGELDGTPAAALSLKSGRALAPAPPSRKPGPPTPAPSRHTAALRTPPRAPPPPLEAVAREPSLRERM